MDIGLVATSGAHSSKYFPIEAFPCTIGRKVGNAVCLSEDPYVSGFHCELSRRSNRLWLKDLDSTNGTYVNGTRILKPTSVFPQKNYNLRGENSASTGYRKTVGG